MSRELEIDAINAGNKPWSISDGGGDEAFEEIIGVNKSLSEFLENYFGRQTIRMLDLMGYGHRITRLQHEGIEVSGEAIALAEFQTPYDVRFSAMDVFSDPIPNDIGEFDFILLTPRGAWAPVVEFIGNDEYPDLGAQIAFVAMMRIARFGKHLKQEVFLWYKFLLSWPIF